MNKKSALKVGVVGVGHFGRFHALKVSKHPREILVGVYDTDKQRSRKIADEMNCQFYECYDDLISAADAIIIASPAETHFELGIKALKKRRHLLVEKPIAATLEEGEALAETADSHQCILQVGHLLRYSAEHNAITQRIKRPLYIEATRLAPFKQRGTDVSVVLDLMIHDLDLIIAIIDSPIMSIDALGASVSSLHDDIANARVRFENGAVATITASRISLKTERHMRIFAQDGYLSANFITQELTFINKKEGISLPGMNDCRREFIQWTEHDNLTAEHNAFVASCLNKKPVIVDAKAGLRALDAALKVAESIRKSKSLIQESGIV